MAGPKYYPILKWKRGEQQATQHLAAADRVDMLPILELQPAKMGALTAADVIPTLDRAKLQGMPVGLDLRLAQAPVTFANLMKICHAASAAGHVAYPVVHAADLLAQMSQLATLKTASGVVLRLRLHLISLAGILPVIAQVRQALGKAVPLHVVYDIGPIGEVPTPAIVAFFEPFVRATLAQGAANYVAMAGGSFPMSLGAFKVGNNYLPRREWLAWQVLRSVPGCDDARFGDYTVTNPDPLSDDLDPRAMNPAAAIRYALDGEWWLLRGRGSKTSGFGQYNTLCRVLVNDPRYSGVAYSYGDGRYHHHAQAGTTSGNYTTWRRDAASHHLVQTIRHLQGLI